MFFLWPQERKALDKAKFKPKHYTNHQKIRALLDLSKGEPVGVVAQKINVSEGRLTSWDRTFEFNRARLNRRLQKRYQSRKEIINSIIDQKARRLMPRLENLLIMAQQTPTALGADFDDDPADPF